MEIIRSIQNRIYEIRGERVMLDRDLAALYETETKALNLAVKRNLQRFPPDFMFQLTKEEFDAIRFQIETLDNKDHPLRLQNETSDNDPSLRLQIETSNKRGGTRYLPYAFTEQGIAMLSGVLHSDKAINMNIAIEHDVQLNHIYDAMENLLDEKAAQRKWEDRERIGFKRVSK